MIRAAYVIALSYGVALLCFTPVAVAAVLFGQRITVRQTARAVGWGAVLIVAVCVLIASMGAGWTWDELVEVTS